MNVLIALTVLGLLSMFSGVFKIRLIILPVTVVGLIISLVLNVIMWNTNHSYFNNMMLVDNYAIAFNAITIVTVLFIVLFYHQFHYKEEVHYSEVFAIILFTAVGAVIMYSFTNLLMLFLGVEILSLSFYVLAGSKKRDLLSNEASLKYFLMGTFSTGFLLFGIAMLYGASGSFSLNEIAAYGKDAAVKPNTFLIAGILLIMTGLLFKVAAAPFQFWTPDVYQGAPTLVTGYMATTGKIAAVAAFLRLFELTFPSLKENYQEVLWAISVLTMLVGNFIAIYQRNVKRMLAYSSISHAGYMLIALVTLNASSNSAILFYSVSYTLASLTAFVIIKVMEQNKMGETYDAFNGLSRSNPLLLFILAIAMLSLAGIPFTAGFFGKFYIFYSAISGGWMWLVIVAVINSFISVYYYFRPILAGIKFQEPGKPVIISPTIKILLLTLTFLTLLFGLLPGLISGII
ncbi:MAG: NADH-quinone oxidoreductase subunit N [Chitinophagales bacterium]|nr:NADH-quinone oxidoreductase subunit N [Chitinophagales bacterium]